jgi:hypothetical protein
MELLVISTRSVPDVGMVSEYVVENFGHQYMWNTVIWPRYIVLVDS